MRRKAERRLLIPLLLACLIPAAPPPAQAAVQLITLPPRERVEIQLDHPGVTLVEEERVVPLAAGENEIVFAWALAAIDRDSIQLRPLEDPEEVRVLSVSYPPGQSALTWQVSARKAGPARVRISYVIGRLDKSYAYRAVASRDETSLTLWQYLLLHNRSSEEFGRAGMWAGFGERLERPIGLDETRKLLTARFSEVPVVKTYTADLSRYGYLDPAKKQLRVPMHYLLKNDAGNGLGEFPLAYGKARIFQEDGNGGVAFLGEDWAAFTPRDDELRLFLGVARDIVVTRTIEKREKTRVLGNLHDYDIVVKYEIENFKDVPAVLDLAESLTALRREILGDTGREVEWELGKGGTLASRVDHERTDAERLVAAVSLPPRGADQKAVKQVHTLHLRLRNEW
jgi:hypothetical protein